MNAPETQDVFTIERHGDVTVVVASPVLEQLDVGLVEQSAGLLLGPLRARDILLVVIDLSGVDYFGSTFLGLLLRCWKLAMTRGGAMVLSGVSTRVKELLHLTSLDMLWPIYADRREAIESLTAN